MPQAKPNYQEIAASWPLWQRYAYLDGAMTEVEFDALSIEQRVQLQIDAFGPEPRVKKVQVAGWTVERTDYPEIPDADQYAGTTYTLRGPNGNQAIYRDIDGDNGVAHRFLRDLMQASQ
jgi:hypothetical protein